MESNVATVSSGNRREWRQEEQNKRRGVVMYGQLAMTIDKEAEECAVFDAERRDISNDSVL